MAHEHGTDPCQLIVASISISKKEHEIDNAKIAVSYWIPSNLHVLSNLSPLKCFSETLSNNSASSS